MRFLANENVPGPVVAGLREHGHDVLAVKESLRGASDHVIVERAHADGRVLITFDKDFGELAIRIGLAAADRRMCSAREVRRSGIRDAQLDLY